MDFLKRDRSPILPRAWSLIDEEAIRVLRLNLAARKLVDFKGPLGLECAAVNLGRLRALDSAPAPDVTAAIRTALSIVELRTGFRLHIGSLDDVARGDEAPDLDAVVRAAERMARAEDHLVFNGYDAAGVVGVIAASPHSPIVVEKVKSWPCAVAKAKETLRLAGVNGPYGLALGPRAYDQVSAGSEDGYPIRKHIEQLISGPIVWAPAVDGAVMLSTRGGDYELTVGLDLSIGYASHDREDVDLFLMETLTFRVHEPIAAVCLRTS